MITKVLLDRIARHEGLRCKAYKDTEGYWTIGYGHLLTPTNKDWSDFSCTPEQAFIWLNEDVEKAFVDATNTPEWQWLNTQTRQEVWIEMIFNLGWAKLKKFTMTRTAIRNQRWDLVSSRMLSSLWAQQVKGRATELASLMQDG